MSFADFARTRIFEPLGMKDTGFYVPKEKLARLRRSTPAPERISRWTPTGPTRRWYRSGRPAVAACFPPRWITRASARCCSQGGQFNGVRLLAPRTVEMMRTNYRESRAAQDHAAGHGLGHGLPGGDGCRGRGRTGFDRHVQLVRHCGHVVLDRSGARPGVRRHGAAPEPGHHAARSTHCRAA